MEATATWNGQDPALSTAAQDDFQQFLDMDMSNLSGGLNFDFQDFAQQHPAMLQHDSGDAMDTALDGEMAMLSSKEAIMQAQMPPMTSPAIMTVPSNNQLNIDTSAASIVDLDAQIQFLQHQRQQQQQRQLEDQQRRYYAQSQMVPPTPNSIELHGGSGQFYQQPDPQQQALYERYQMRLKEQEMSFTPLVSPAVTPLEAHFSIPEYTVPGAYFSPLSSPALLAQNEHRNVYENHLNPVIPTTPLDKSGDVTPGALINGSLKKPTKKPAAKPKSRSVRQSPIVKPQRKKGTSTVISPQALSDILEPTSQTQSFTQATGSSRSGTDGSETESISPEHLSEMAPPPLPKPSSAKSSPFLSSQNGQSRKHQSLMSGGMSPATPASLMRLPKSDQAATVADADMELDDHAMNGFALPEAANPPQPVLAADEPFATGDITPTLESTSTRTAGPLPPPSPAVARVQNASLHNSPLLASQDGGSSTTSTPNPRKTPLVNPRGARKRQSISSIHVSPALRPKISPSIKPLLRGSLPSTTSLTSISDDTASLLLASKSNYQNILEGTHLPGVSYPTELSTNLTSKRTSHKIAEQGRRNRINSALQEIATLLPKSCSGKEKDSSGEKSGSPDADEVNDKGEPKTPTQSANSKASTVEQAIEYIKQLKKEVEDANRRAEEAERRLDVKTAV